MLFKISKTSGNIPVIFACNSAFISLVFCCDRFCYNSNFSNLSSDIMYNTSNSLNYLPLHIKNISRQSHIIMSFLSNNYSQCKLRPNINVFVIFLSSLGPSFVFWGGGGEVRGEGDKVVCS